MSRDHDYWVYMMSNKTRSTLYIGVTNDLLVRIAQHRGSEIAGFTRDITAFIWFTANTSATFVMPSPVRSN